MSKKINSKLLLLLIPLMLFSAFLLSSCGASDIVNSVLSNDVAAKDRLDSANAQATRRYGVGTSLVLIFGRNVKSNGKTDISVITALSNPDSLGAWLYVYRIPGNTFKVFTPDPTPTTSDCIELTSVFDLNTVIGLITDTSARNIVSGALGLIASSNISITTPTASLINSDAALSLANSTNPIIKFDANFTPSASILNGNTFNTAAGTKTTNMFLIPAGGTLHLPTYISQLTGFPNDLWVANYKNTDNANVTTNLVLGTVVQSGQVMGIHNLTLTSTVIDLSKYVTQ
jgi:hypothetical protein